MLQEMKDVTKQLRHRYTIQWMKTFKFVLVEKLYTEQSEAKKKYIKIKREPKKLNFGALKPGVRGAPPGSASAKMSNMYSVYSGLLPLPGGKAICYSRVFEKPSILGA